MSSRIPGLDIRLRQLLVPFDDHRHKHLAISKQGMHPGIEGDLGTAKGEYRNTTFRG